MTDADAEMAAGNTWLHTFGRALASRTMLVLLLIQLSFGVQTMLFGLVVDGWSWSEFIDDVDYVGTTLLFLAASRALAALYSVADHHDARLLQ
ncbi:hypothetical protein [Gordonia hongkongensis]|uniref:hypothetical protein n=1 Tax=Gordonia hongkongensis TaxID=1701090 RepID=UPI003D71676B